MPLFQDAEAISKPARFNVDNDGVMSRCDGEQRHDDNGDVYVDEYVRNNRCRGKCIAVVLVVFSL